MSSSHTPSTESKGGTHYFRVEDVSSTSRDVSGDHNDSVIRVPYCTVAGGHVQYEYRPKDHEHTHGQDVDVANVKNKGDFSKSDLDFSEGKCSSTTTDNKNARALRPWQ